MALYDYRCGSGHVTELVRTPSTLTVDCPVCGQLAERSRVHRFDVVGPTVDTRGMFRRYQEATQEIDHNASRIEASTGQPVQTPSLYQVAKQRAAAMDAAGEAFRPVGT